MGLAGSALYTVESEERMEAAGRGLNSTILALYSELGLFVLFSLAASLRL